MTRRIPDPAARFPRPLKRTLVGLVLVLTLSACESQASKEAPKETSQAPRPDAHVVSFSPDRTERFVADAFTGTAQRLEGPLNVVSPAEKSFSVDVISANEIEVVDQETSSQRSLPRHDLGRGLGSSPGNRQRFQLDEGTQLDSWSVNSIGTKLAVVARRPLSGSDTQAVVSVYEMDSGKRLSQFDFRAYSGEEMSVGWSPSSDWLFVTQDEIHVAYFRPEDAEATFRLLNTKFAERFEVTPDLVHPRAGVNCEARSNEPESNLSAAPT